MKAMTNLLKQVSKLPLAFGGASISGEGAGYGFGDITEADAISLLQYAKERGVTIFDTAPIYGFGTSEKRIGKAFNSDREDVFIISKSGVTWHENKRVDMTNDPQVTTKMLEQSLRDLDTDYIDLYMIHWPDEKVDIRRPLEVLAKAKLEGKIKHIGLCNSFEEDYKKASEIDRIDMFQSQLNFFERDALNDLIPLAQKDNVSFMSWGTLDKGILTGRVNRDRKFDKSDCRSWAPWWKAMDKESRYTVMERLLPHLEQKGFSGLQMALSFNLSRGVDSLLCGTRSHQQLDSVIDAINNPLSYEVLKEVEDLASES
jgi:myo-inositol catabolism protein IolS